MGLDGKVAVYRLGLVRRKSAVVCCRDIQFRNSGGVEELCGGFWRVFV